MEIISQNPVVAWLVFGVFLIGVEAFTMPGLGLFLAGLGAICTAILIEAGVVGVAAEAAQFAWFFGLTVLWTIVLWVPLQKFRMASKGKTGAGFSNVIGETAIVGKDGLTRGTTGQVTWSGTLMSAELDAASAAETLAAGAQVVIVSVFGTTLKVIPK
jgi:membrane protein implicated in regulation of membrane protease activity